ncbi:MAG TPA: sulfatase-like hydrolase/transferase [Piscinibacter sp.]|jgi:hypothetical protein|uniref:sulfatase-like hydrolase/transferase n=1 Tax=Piscinibacter sp. TaxID=1903157 RepID=UPI0011DC667A|nr:MAG: hypothetical protein E6Q93_09200 [Burkholderiaceae bacterium]HNJ82003.1 sulfatase-like hydrolase/transferase [Piscinibacter sp.]HNK16776.1 sulfatase-like hydrolase/transferase [Piscinibacter sp.]
MTLSARQGLAASLGLGSLALLPAWDAVLSLPGAARGWTPLAWVLGGTLTLTIALEMCRRASRPARLMLGLAVGAVLAALLFETLAFFYVDLKNSLAVVAGPWYRWARDLIAAAVLLASGFLLWLGVRKGASWIRGLLSEALALLAALPAVLVVSYLMPGAMPPQHESAAQARRVVVALVLDELDTSAIDADIANLPNFAAIRARAFSASRMYPPANYTSESLPGMIAGENFEQATYSRRDVHVLPAGSSDWLSLSGRGTLFEDARQRGARAALIGWHLPYCTIVRTAYPCWDDAAYRAPGHSISLPVWLLGHSRLYSAAENRWLDGKAADVREYSRAFLSSAQNYRLQHIGEIFADQHNALLQTLESGRSELVFAHLACPHAPSLHRDQVAKLDMFQAYAANLRVCDRLLGEVLGLLERGRYADGWALAVTSDHWFRGRDWLDAGRPLSTPSARRPVPFYLLTAGAAAPETTDVTSNSRVLRRLVIDALDPGFMPARARSLIESQGDSPTILRRF